MCVEEAAGDASDSDELRGFKPGREALGLDLNGAGEAPRSDCGVTEGTGLEAPESLSHMAGRYEWGGAQVAKMPRFIRMPWRGRESLTSASGSRTG